ncbi:GOLPH3/VPS74 family protein [Ornithinimicrobium faecis]|uniref:GPP34 family phosphoprotein n=1 Tax=Ornithinimicrobium faecis TaxID=2934158 RepID=A0ABY4YW91_9MICO|nr:MULTISPECIES: GPP34 family phosphoprotein [unclassified Ornithinimicrobium]USQ80867.1 GPP34 family phosphoprotein [Ornithinimicrobium sp. HY1793]
MASTTPAHSDLLLVDDLMLLLMDDDGASVQGAGTLYYTLGGAVLTELALLGRVEVDDSGVLNGPRVTPVGREPLPDPLLQSAFDLVAKKTQRVQPLLIGIGADLWKVVRDRLVDRGLLRREEKRVLGVFRTTRWPAADAHHEAELRARIRRVLEDGETPDPRTAAIIALLSASGAMPSLRPPLPWTNQTVTRAKEIERGEWGAQAVSTAVTRTAAGIAASSAAVAISVAASR